MDQKEVRQLAAIMFTDIVGYTAMMEKDEQQALQAIGTIRKILTELTEKYSGHFRKEIGDGTLSSFSSAMDAAQCAMELQARIGSEPFQLRIGIHVGEVTFSQNDIFGDGVNIASRLEPLAPPGGIFISDRVYEDIQNKAGIKADLVGTRDLKNVSRPIRVFALTGEGLASPSMKSDTPSILTVLLDLWDRRFFQITAAYIILGYIVLRLMDYAVDTYLLSPHWTQFSFVLLVSILPSIGVVAFYHGKGGLDRWVTAEKITLPVNAVFTAILLIVIFQGKQLGAATKQIATTDEEGKRIERAIAKAEFRKRIAIFGFQNKTGDQSLDWWSTGAPLALQTDLYQNLFVKVKGPLDLAEEAERSGKTDLADLPLPLMRKIAQDFRLDYFVHGEFSGTSEHMTLRYTLYESESAKLVATRDFEAKDPFDAIDEMGIQLQKDLEIPESHLAATSNLPVSGILTNNLDSYHGYILGSKAISLKNDYRSGIKHLSDALKLDPQFAYAHLVMAVAFLATNQLSPAKASIEKVMENIYALAERDQFLAKSFNFLVTGDSDKRIKVLRMWSEFYPEDMEAAKYLGLVLQISGNLEEAKAVFERAIEIDDDRGNFYVHLAKIMEAQQDLEGALVNYQLYAEKYPTHPRSFTLLGNFYLNEGDFDKTNQYFEKALLLDERNTQLKGEIALVKERTGRFDEALENYKTILAECRSPVDSVAIISQIRDFYYKTGQIKTGIEWWDLHLRTAEKTQAPVNVSMTRITRLEWFMGTGRSERALEIIETEEEKFKDSFTDMIAFGYMGYYLQLGDVPKAEEYFNRILNHTAKYGSSGNIDDYYLAELYYLKGAYSDALTTYQSFSETNLFVPHLYLNIRIARTLQKLGKLDEAITVLEEFLVTDPYNPEANYELAILYAEKGATDKAIELLGTSLRVWEKADLDYELALAAKAKYEQLTSSLSRVSG